MAHDTDRPVPSLHSIDSKQTEAILLELLELERERLRQAVKMEKDRNIVFPETTVIIKDIERLLGALGQTDETDSPPVQRDNQQTKAPSKGWRV